MYIYEKAFKESISLCLSIERQWLLIQEELAKAIGPGNALHILDRLIHLMEILERNDAKVRLLQELANCGSKIDLLSTSFDGEVLTATKLKDRCDKVSRSLTVASRVLSRNLMSDGFLSRFYYRQENVYDSIYADIWSKQQSKDIKMEVQAWLAELDHVWQAVEMILWLVRSSGHFQEIKVGSGFHRENLVQDIMKISMVRVQRPQLDLLPSLTMAQHWLVITVYKMMWSEGTYQAKQSSEPISVSLALCR